MWRGTVRTWRDEKGFGFIVPDAGGADVFFHISSVAGVGRRPQVGDVVNYDTATGTDGKTKAVGVRYVSVTGTERRTNPVPWVMAAFCIGAGIYQCVRTGLPVVLTYPAVGLLTYAVYAHDKGEAQRGGYRIPEAHLHLLELLGGWIGGYMAQEWLRHKSAKPSYQMAFWVIAALHVVGWVGWLYLTLTKVNR